MLDAHANCAWNTQDHRLHVWLSFELLRIEVWDVTPCVAFQNLKILRWLFQDGIASYGAIAS